MNVCDYTKEESSYRGIMTGNTNDSGRDGSGFIHVEMLDPPETGRGGTKVRERNVIPVGIFLMLFFIEGCIAAGASIAYFIYAGTSGIGEIESYVRSHSLSTAEAFAAEAGPGIRKKKFSGLRSLFRDTMDKGTIDEAFLVLSDGTFVVREERGAGTKSEAGDADSEWSHSLAMILAPVRRATRETIIADYSVPSRPVPFRDDVRPLLRRYLYPGIESNGWLVTRAVFVKKKPAGAVGFIVGKQKIYDFIEAHMYASLHVFLVGLGGAFLVSLALSLVVFLRYRSIRRGSARPGGGGGAARNELYDMTPDGPPGRDSRVATAPSSEGGPIGRGSGIRDAIPVREKE